MLQAIKRIKFRRHYHAFLDACQNGNAKRVSKYVNEQYSLYQNLAIERFICGALLALEHNQKQVLTILVEIITNPADIYFTTRQLIRKEHVELLHHMLHQQEVRFNKPSIDTMLTLAVKQHSTASFNYLLSQFRNTITPADTHNAFLCACEDYIERDSDEPDPSHFLISLGALGIIPNHFLRFKSIMEATFGKADNMEQWPESPPLELHKILLNRYLTATGLSPLEYLSEVSEKNKPALLALMSGPA